MADFSKFINLDENVLLEWVFSDTDFISENYNVLTNVNEGIRSFISTTNLNKVGNTTFVVDEVLRRYSPVNTSNFPFLQLQSYSSPNVPYDTIKINFPSNFNFEDDDYRGFIIRIYTFDITNKKIIPFSTYFFDDTDPLRQNQIQFRNPFLYNTKQWSKFISFKIPNLDYIANQREIINGVNQPIDNSINDEVTNGVGLSIDAPIFIEFSFITTKENRFGVTYYNTTPKFKTSIPKVPEYQDLSVTIKESIQGDYYEIFGEWSGSNESFDDFIERLEQRGLKIQVEYDISVYEENILQRTQTFLVTENFSRKIVYRPVITFSNTTAMIDVQMRIKNIVNNDTISRITSIGITGNNLLKYGANLRRINVNNVVKPKIYNLKTQGGQQSDIISPQQTITVVERVPYPILYERYNILASASASLNSEFVSFGQLELILSPVDTVIRFVIAERINANSEAELYNITKISQNSKIIMRFETSDKSKKLDKEMYYEGENDLANGIIHFKISESDLFTLRSIYTTSNKFYLIVYNEDEESRILLYSGTYRLFNDTIFTSIGRPQSSAVATNQNTLSFGTQPEIVSESLQELDVSDITNLSEQTQLNQQDVNGQAISNGQQGIQADTVEATKRQNIIVFLTRQANQVAFESSLTNIINSNVYSKGGQMYVKYNRSYIILSVTEAETQEIFKITGVDQKGSAIIPFGLGEGVARGLTDNLGKVKELENEANTIFETWIQTAQFTGTGNPSFNAPTQSSKQQLINMVEPIVEELNQLGFKLGKNPDTDKMWLTIPNDGQGSHYIGI